MHALTEVQLLLYQRLRTRTEYTYLTFCFPPETCAEEHYTPSSDKINQQTRLLKGLNYCNHFVSRFLCTGSWTLNCKINLDFRAWFWLYSQFVGFFQWPGILQRNLYCNLRYLRINLIRLEILWRRSMQKSVLIELSIRRLLEFNNSWSESELKECISYGGA